MGRENPGRRSASRHRVAIGAGPGPCGRAPQADYHHAGPLGQFDGPGSRRSARREWLGGRAAARAWTRTALLAGPELPAAAVVGDPHGPPVLGRAVPPDPPPLAFRSRQEQDTARRASGPARPDRLRPRRTSSIHGDRATAAARVLPVGREHCGRPGPVASTGGAASGYDRPGGSGVNGIHDLGGMHGFGPVEPGPNEPPSTAGGRRRWSPSCARPRGAASTTSTSSATGSSAWPAPVSRLQLLRALARRHRADPRREGRGRPRDEMDARTGAVRARPDAPAGPRPRPTSPAAQPATPLPDRDRAAALRRSAPPCVDAEHPPPGHTRLPRYARGKRGVIAAHRGVPRVPRRQRPRPRRAAPARLQRAVRRPRAVGRGGRAQRSTCTWISGRATCSRR